jgi:hypothetical protein
MKKVWTWFYEDGAFIPLGAGFLLASYVRVLG